jgi:hypothetical protein
MALFLHFLELLSSNIDVRNVGGVSFFDL